jgi:kumamolisin
MLTIDNRTALAGSDPDIRPGVRCIGSPEPDERVHVAILLHPRGSMGGSSERSEVLSGGFEFVRGADLGHVAQILEFALEYGLTVVETSVSRRRVLLTGTASAVGIAFGTPLGVFEYPGGRYRGRTTALRLPGNLARIVQSVTGI